MAGAYMERTGVVNGSSQYELQLYSPYISAPGVCSVGSDNGVVTAIGCSLRCVCDVQGVLHRDNRDIAIMLQGGSDIAPMAIVRA